MDMLQSVFLLVPNRLLFNKVLRILIIQLKEKFKCLIIRINQVSIRPCSFISSGQIFIWPWSYNMWEYREEKKKKCYNRPKCHKILTKIG